MPITLYALDHWLHRLGVQRWALVQVLRRLALDAPWSPDGTKHLEITREAIAQRLGVEWDGTIGEWLKSKKVKGGGGWRRIDPVNEQAEALSQFIVRLRYRYVRGEDGKTRRTGLILCIRMDDPPIPEDLPRVLEAERAIAQALQLPSERVTTTLTGTAPDVNKLNPTSLVSVKPGLPTSREPVKQESATSQEVVNTADPTSLAAVKQEPPTSQGVKSVDPSALTLTFNRTRISDNEVQKELGPLRNAVAAVHRGLRDGRRIRGVVGPIVKVMEETLEDYHSTGMLYRVLTALYRADQLELLVEVVALVFAEAGEGGEANLGAMFVREMKARASREGIDLGLGGNGLPGASGQRSYVLEDPTEEPGIEEEPVSTAGFEIAGAGNSEQVWRETLGELEAHLGRATFGQWLPGTRIVGYQVDASGHEVIVVGATVKRRVEWLSQRLNQSVQRALAVVVGRSVDVSFVVVDGSNRAEPQ